MTSKPRLAAFDADAFLRDSWQQQPCLIRNPWAAWVNPLDPDELAGLACDPDMESRLITRAGGDWHYEDGPLADDRFARMGSAPWTVLVQAADHMVPQVAALLAAFAFIPNWRVDDVMVSYAVDGGGVGPHFDRYDVFLVQGLGRRRWQVGGRCDEDMVLRANADARLLAAFAPVAEWLLEPGDILYLPPGFAHDGVAVGDDCMTYSIGFRAPSRGELIAGWAEHVAAQTGDDDRYTDGPLSPAANPGEISTDAIARLHAMAMDGLADRAAFARWFGQMSSSPKYPDIDWRPDEPMSLAEVSAALAAGARVRRNPASRFMFVAEGEDAAALFVDGRCHDCTGAAAVFARRLCAAACVTVDVGSPAVTELVTILLNEGSIAFD